METVLSPGELAAAGDLPLEYAAVPADQLISGLPQTGTADLGSFKGTGIGVWEMTPGAMSDTEADEVFVVLRGSATVEFLDTGRRLAIGPGDVVRLGAGQRTIWTVTEALRKVYVA